MVILPPFDGWRNKVQGISVFSIIRCKCVGHSVMPDSATPWTVAHQAPLSMGFSRQEYWSGLPLLSPRGLPGPGIELRSLAEQADSLLSEPQCKQVRFRQIKVDLNNKNLKKCLPIKKIKQMS